MNENQKRRMAKIIALYNGSNGGEQASALAKLQVICKAHNINIDDLLSENEEILTFEVSYSSVLERKLIYQIISMVNIDRECGRYRSCRKIWVEMTKTEYAEFSLYWSRWRMALTDHLELALTAFIQSNKIYSDRVPARALSELSEEEISYRQKVLLMSSATEPTPVHKALTCKD